MGYIIKRLASKVLITYSGNTVFTASVDPCYNVLAGNWDERVIAISIGGTNQGLIQNAAAHFPWDDIDSCLDIVGTELAPFSSRDQAIEELSNYIFTCAAGEPAPPPCDPCYFDGKKDLAGEILAMNANDHQGETWWAFDEKIAYKSVSPATGGGYTWVAVGVRYDEETDTFTLGDTVDGQTQNLGQESFFNGFNDDVTGANAILPKLFIAGSVYAVNEKFYSCTKVSASGLSPGAVYGLNTTNLLSGGFGKIATYGELNGLDTSAWPVNAILYADTTAGELTTVRPVADIYPIAIVKKSDPISGVLFVNTVSGTREDTAVSPVSFNQSWFTADEETTAAGTFYTLSQIDQGISPPVSQSIVVNDNTTGWVGQDTLGPIYSGDGEVAAKQYFSRVEFEVNNSLAQEQLFMEVYLANADGVVVDSGSGLPNGDLGVPPIVVLDSPVLNITDDTTQFAELSGFIPVAISYADGQRPRYHIGARKVGTQGANKTFEIYQGDQTDTFVIEPTPIKASDVLYDNTNSDLLSENVQSAIDEMDAQYMKFAFNYQPGDPVTRNTVANDEGWLMISNKATTDRAAPQSSEDPSYDLPDSPSWVTNQFTGTVHSGHRYTFTHKGYFQAIEAWVPVITPDTRYRFIIFRPATGTFTVIEESILQPGQWSLLRVNDVLIQAGEEVIVYMESINSNATTPVSGDWQYDGTSQNQQPGAQEWNTNNARTLLRISETDLASNNRQADLLSIDTGSTIDMVQISDPNKSVKFAVLDDPVVVGAFVHYTVVETDQGIGGLPDVGADCAMDAQIPIPQPTDYVELPGYFPGGNPSWATVEGYLSLEDVEQPSAATSAFGIRARFQPLVASPDWDVMDIP